MAEMTILRKTDISLYYYIKEVILCNFVEQDELVPLKLMELISTDTSMVYESESTMHPNPTERGRGWLYFDASIDYNACTGFFDTVSGTRADGVAILGVPEQSNRVIVYTDYTIVSGVINHIGVIPQNEYMLDYIDGRVITSGTVMPVYVDYYWNYVSVVDEWAAIEAAEPPVVVIDIQGTDKNGYQLGGEIGRAHV
jgi:hypothetical protein